MGQAEGPVTVSAPSIDSGEVPTLVAAPPSATAIGRVPVGASAAAAMVKEAETVSPDGTSTVAGSNVIPELVGVSIMAPPSAGWSSDMVTAVLATPFATTLVAADSVTALTSADRTRDAAVATTSSASSRRAGALAIGAPIAMPQERTEAPGRRSPGRVCHPWAHGSRWEWERHTVSGTPLERAR